MSTIVGQPLAKVAKPLHIRGKDTGHFGVTSIISFILGAAIVLGSISLIATLLGAG